MKDVILQQIQKEGIQPKSRKYFIFIHTFVWIGIVLSVLVGSLSVSMLLVEWNMPEQVLARIVHKNENLRLISLLPYIWILITAIVVWPIIKLFQETKTGYRYHPVWIITGILFCSLIGGSLLFSSRVSHVVQNLVAHKTPYGRIHDDWREEVLDVDHWILLGQVSVGDRKITLTDSQEQEWDIVCEDMWKCLQKSQEHHGKFLIVIGEETAYQEFTAQDIRIPPRGFQKKWGDFQAKRIVDHLKKTYQDAPGDIRSIMDKYRTNEEITNEEKNLLKMYIKQSKPLRNTRDNLGRKKGSWKSNLVHDPLRD